MVRPRRTRRIFFQPDVTYFKPAGVPMRDLKEVILSFDELEAVRLVDSENIGQTQAGKKMKISQSTLSRLLKSARQKLALAIVEGRAIKIYGGDFKFMSQKNGFSLNDFCSCPNCGYKQKHILGEPCSKQKCPQCGNLLTRR